MLLIALFTVGVREQRGVGQQELSILPAQLLDRSVVGQRALLLGVLQDLALLLLGGIEAAQHAFDDTSLGRGHLAIGPSDRDQGFDDVFLARGHLPTNITKVRLRRESPWPKLVPRITFARLHARFREIHVSRAPGRVSAPEAR